MTTKRKTREPMLTISIPLSAIEGNRALKFLVRKLLSEMAKPVPPVKLTPRMP